MISFIKHSSTYFLVVSIMIFTSTAVNADGHLAKVTSEEVTVWSNGTRMDGDLWKPENIAENEKLPGIVVVNGWGGTKEHLNSSYAPQFASLGFVVLTIDYRGWGDSDGILMADEPVPAADKDGYVTVRMKELIELVDPVEQAKDTAAALHFIAGDVNVDASRLGLWGTSLGGGVIFSAALQDSRVKAMVSQIGAVNTAGNSNFKQKEIDGWFSARARGEAVQYPGADAKNPLFRGLPDYVKFAQVNSMARADELNAAALFIDAESEELFDRKKNGKLLHEKLKARGVKTKYMTVPGKHYDVYRGEQYKVALKAAGDWFVAVLK